MQDTLETSLFARHLFPTDDGPEYRQPIPLASIDLARIMPTFGPHFSGYTTYGLFVAVPQYSVETVVKITQQVVNMLNTHRKP